MRASNVGFELGCMLFPTTLIGAANSWFDKVHRHSISPWEQLSTNFKKQFRDPKSIKLVASSLENIKQQSGESLKKYIVRFNIEASLARDVDDSNHLMAIRAGILPESAFWDDLQQKSVRTIMEFTLRAQRFINVEEAMLT
ncbi:uncharacterized protein LOC133814741 [Humulus lupulus]|uniref:uncharacterized protein LOC133814741 n=1 Tax=Humulus lupulus TaxID=3486 RepID=UPI002B4044E5|nr:uncharacterized protein LOC133814741 [Humulus lupulus]